MTKEKFLYELIDNWLCMVSRLCVLIENYTQKDRTDVYMQCSDILKTCMLFYDKIHKKMDSGEYMPCEIDEKLEYIIQALKQESMRMFIEEIKLHISNYTDTMDGIKNLIEKYWFGENQKEIFSKQSLSCFMKEVREYEARTGE